MEDKSTRTFVNSTSTKILPTSTYISTTWSEPSCLDKRSWTSDCLSSCCSSTTWSPCFYSWWKYQSQASTFCEERPSIITSGMSLTLIKWNETSWFQHFTYKRWWPVFSTSDHNGSTLARTSGRKRSSWSGMIKLTLISCMHTLLHIKLSSLWICLISLIELHMRIKAP
jgi:hypothetical protein